MIEIWDHIDWSLVMKLLELVVKPTVIDICKTGKQLREIDLSKKDNFLSLKKINLGFDVERVIENVIYLQFPRLKYSIKEF